MARKFLFQMALLSSLVAILFSGQQYMMSELNVHDRAIESLSVPKRNFSGMSVYERLDESGCLPETCRKCIHEFQYTGDICEASGCLSRCSCFCEKLCSYEPVHKKAAGMRNRMNATQYNRSNTMRYKRTNTTKHQYDRVPRIVHQTWMHPIQAQDLSARLPNSFRTSGWDYRFYLDEDAAAFIAENFPPEVLEAYESLIPGAFKADLFRYCVLYVHGGVYADVDILLESNLDAIVTDDVTFMAPTDEPVGCLWNGFMASVPKHPFLLRAIEQTVNRVRRQETSVDVVAQTCPPANFIPLFQHDVLYVSGPCALGMAVNTVLGNHPQATFEAGHFETTDVGKVVILSQNKSDLGAMRLNEVVSNLIVAATGMEEIRKDAETMEGHYGLSRDGWQIYGLSKVYSGVKYADEFELA